ncbi:tRNA pseudouridine(55) synthase TruB [Floccifex sp.]|uniref:tRNA pseudouridine(55) synthase TruB n=1 Tax=Floccifex sp. TaxID=2815810 RepID=UPI003F0FFF14
MDGIIVVNKPKGMTSHDVVNVLRHKLKQKKIGHTGTLDPEASGVLLILAGKACKALQFLKDTDKTYQTSIEFGYITDSDDIFGNKIEVKEINYDFDFEKVLQSFIGPQKQKVPMASAKKINGKKLMEYQREGISNIDVYNEIEIYSISVLSKENYSFEVHCSSGTYIRSICRDFGYKTNNLCCMKELVRTKVGRFTLDMAQNLDEIEIDTVKLYPLSYLLDHIERIDYEPVLDIYNGKHVRIQTNANQVCIYDKEKPIAIYQRDHFDVFKSIRGLW